MKKLLLLLVVGVLALPGLAWGQERLSPTQIDEISQSVVLIAVLADTEPIAVGTGVFINPTGRLLTNYHVIADGDTFGIFMLEDINELPVLRYYAEIEATYEENDLAVLQITQNDVGRRTIPNNLPHVDLDTLEEVNRGDDVFVFGYPTLGDGYMVLTNGTITTIQNGDINGERMPVWYQTDAEASPGNSGGLAVTGNGNPVGIPTLVVSEAVTGARLSGILPFVAINKILEDEAGFTVSSNQAAGSIFGNSGGGASGLGAANISTTCDTGEQITNGTQVTVVQMRPGFSYRATVISLGSFDPILMVNYPNGTGYCNDDNPDAARYTATLPGVGTVLGRETDAQVIFTQNQGAMTDVSLVVGGYNGASGEFLLMLEGMAFTTADEFGDPFYVLLTESVVDSGVPVGVYMLAKANNLDPLILTVNQAADDLMQDMFGEYILCDDGGTRSCWGDSDRLTSASLRSPASTIDAQETDAMLRFPGRDTVQTGYEELFLLMSSYNQESHGEYVLIFHFGIR